AESAPTEAAAEQDSSVGQAEAPVERPSSPEGVGETAPAVVPSEGEKQQ
ncbi:MAG: hypothetical protein H0W14_03995, partial [Actinobacteria bacterium]|nr:hypothetical protein [Actinomycetota bacterium]